MNISSMNWYSIIWCDEISYNMTSYASSMRSIAWLKWRKCWTIRQVVWKWYDDTSCDMISYHSRGRGCRRGRGLCSRWRRETFFGNFTLKKWPSKIHENAKKIRKKILYIFIVESLQDDMFLFELWQILFST